MKKNVIFLDSYSYLFAVFPYFILWLLLLYMICNCYICQYYILLLLVYYEMMWLKSDSQKTHHSPCCRQYYIFVYKYQCYISYLTMMSLCYILNLMSIWVFKRLFFIKIMPLYGFAIHANCMVWIFSMDFSMF